MNKLILTILAAAALTSAQAQFLSPQALNGAFLGTVIGGIAGGNNHCGFSGTGAAIGAGVGLLAGAVVGEVQRQSYCASQPYYYSPAPVYAQPGYGYIAAPVYVPAPPQPSYAVGGTSPAPAVAPPQPVYQPVANASWAPQIPDAPRVPDAPTF